MADLHPRAPWKDVAFAGAYWNCEERLDALLSYVRPWFSRIVTVVQESPDNTLAVAKKYADVVIQEPWHGRGDPSIHTAVYSAEKRWCFVISDDERPSEDLLYSFQNLANQLKAENRDGAWVRFRSSIDGFDFSRDQDFHLRFFNPTLGWPKEPHSRPPTENTLHWDVGYVQHDRSLDEMMQDYLRRYDLTAEHPEWVQQQAANVRMMLTAPRAIAEKRGWDYVKSFEWWPRVRDISFDGVDPVDPTPEPTSEQEPSADVAAPAPKRRRRRS